MYNILLDVLSLEARPILPSDEEKVLVCEAGCEEFL